MIQDVPIPISVIGKAQVEDAGAFNVNRVKELVPSVQLYSSNPRNTGLNIRGLGSSFGLTNDGVDPGVGFYVDGVYYARPAATTLDFIDIERIEVLKGPSATLYGSSLTSFGGAINTITKKPYDTLGGTIAVSSGSWGLQRITADFNTPVNKARTLLFRVNGVYHYQNSFQDYGFTKRMSIAPSISYKASERLSFQIDAKLSQIQATLTPWYYADSATTGVTSAEQLNINYRKYYFPGDIFPTTKTTNVMAQMNYVLSDKWKSQTIFSSSVNQTEGASTYLWFISDSSVTRNNQAYEGTTSQLNVQQNFLGDFKLLHMRHRFLGGLDYYRNHSNSTYKFIPGMLDTILTAGPHPNYTDYNKAKFNNSIPSYFFGSYTGIQQTERTGVYVSDVINLTEKILFNAGVRFDYFASAGYYDPNSDTTIGKYQQSAFSPKFGLVYQLVKDKLALFTNYQNSFQNVTGRDFDGNVFVPQRANQLEGGLKFALLKNKVSGSVSVYDIVVTNTVRADVQHPLFSKQDGTQESKGIEAELVVTAAKGLYVNIGYGYNDNKYITAGDDVKGRRPVEAGPAHLGHAWVNYKLEEGSLKGLGIGLGGNSASRKHTNNDTFAGVFYVPSYVVMNAALFYDRPVFRLSMNVNNATNKKYWVGWNQLAPQAPRELVVSAAWKF